MELVAESGKKKEEEWIGGAQQGFWGEETPIGKERTE